MVWLPTSSVEFISNKVHCNLIQGTGVSSVISDVVPAKRRDMPGSCPVGLDSGPIVPSNSTLRPGSVDGRVSSADTTADATKLRRLTFRLILLQSPNLIDPDKTGK